MSTEAEANPRARTTEPEVSLGYSYYVLGVLFILNIVGLGAGSFLVGLLNDQLADRFGIETIRDSLLAVALVGGLASLFFLQASRTLREDLRARDA